MIKNENYVRYAALIETIRRKNEEFIATQPRVFQESWKRLVGRRKEIQSVEKPASGMYAAFWFAEAFPKINKELMVQIGQAHYSMYLFDLLFDDASDLNINYRHKRDEQTKDYFLAQIYLGDSISKLHQIVENESFSKECNELLKRYHENEKAVNKRKKTNAVFGISEFQRADDSKVNVREEIKFPGVQEYKDTCGLLKISGSVLAHKFYELNLWEKIKEGFDNTAIGVVFLDDIVDFQDDVMNNGRTLPIYQVYRTINRDEFHKTVSLERAKELKDILYAEGIAKSNLEKGLEHLEQAKKIFKGCSCESWEEYTDQQIHFINEFKETLARFKRKNISKKIDKLKEKDYGAS
jgi:Fe-S cluster biosynthesis and repair protein YggX